MGLLSGISEDMMKAGFQLLGWWPRSFYKGHDRKENEILVGGFKHGVYFPFHIWDVILPIDELIFFRWVETLKPANQDSLNNQC